MPTLPKNSKRPAWMGERKPFDSGRITARWEGYNKQYWIKFRDAFRASNPICCVEGCRQPTYYVDHKDPVLQLIAQGRNPLDPNECQPLCFKHGNKKTGHEGKAKQMKMRGDKDDPHGGGIKDGRLC